MRHLSELLTILKAADKLEKSDERIFSTVGKLIKDYTVSLMEEDGYPYTESGDAKIFNVDGDKYELTPFFQDIYKKLREKVNVDIVKDLVLTSDETKKESEESKEEYGATVVIPELENEPVYEDNDKQEESSDIFSLIDEPDEETELDEPEYTFTEKDCVEITKEEISMEAGRLVVTNAAGKKIARYNMMFFPYSTDEGETRFFLRLEGKGITPQFYSCDGEYLIPFDSHSLKLSCRVEEGKPVVNVEAVSEEGEVLTVKKNVISFTGSKGHIVMVDSDNYLAVHILPLNLMENGDATFCYAVVHKDSIIKTGTTDEEKIPYFTFDDQNYYIQAKWEDSVFYGNVTDNEQ